MYSPTLVLFRVQVFCMYLLYVRPTVPGAHLYVNVCTYVLRVGNCIIKTALSISTYIYIHFLQQIDIIVVVDFLLSIIIISSSDDETSYNLN